MSFIQQAMATFSSLVAPDADPVSIREQILQGFGQEQHEQMQAEFNPPVVTRQPTDVPEVADFEAAHPNELPEWNEATPEDQVIPEGDAMIPIEYDKSLKYADEQATTELEEKMEGKRPTLQMTDENNAMGSLVDFIKSKENPKEMGLEQTEAGERFTVFDVPNSAIGEKNIGWGIMVQPGWLTTNPAKWPVLNGEPLDIREGITRKQAEGLLNQELDQAKVSAEKKVPSWNKMLPVEQRFWTDLRYNGGPKVFSKSPKAMAAAKEGYTAEAMIKSLDFIKSGNKSVKGLFLRRIEAYNQAAQELPGVPKIEKITWGKQAKVKFAHQIKSTKVSKSFTNRVNKTGNGWFTISTTSGVKGEETMKIK